jgi:hypothetical protein
LRAIRRPSEALPREEIVRPSVVTVEARESVLRVVEREVVVAGREDRIEGSFLSERVAETKRAAARRLGSTPGGASSRFMRREPASPS